MSIIDAARAILPELPVLLSLEESTHYDEQIRTLLAQIETNPAQTTQLSALLRQSEITRQWMQQFLQGEDPAQVTRSLHLPGNAAPIPSSLEYQCQACGKSLKSPQKGIIPKCPDHKNAPVKPIETT
jgi:hypothetical protein